VFSDRGDTASLCFIAAQLTNQDEVSTSKGTLDEKRHNTGAQFKHYAHRASADQRKGRAGKFPAFLRQLLTVAQADPKG